jgi:hypothetical protein
MAKAEIDRMICHMRIRVYCTGPWDRAKRCPHSQIQDIGYVYVSENETSGTANHLWHEFQATSSPSSDYSEDLRRMIWQREGLVGYTSKGQLPFLKILEVCILTLG